MSLVLDEHRKLLSDEPRLSCFRKAVGEVVRPGDIVVDLASGTGVLGLFACQAGAARVYSIDQGPILGLTQQICRANGFEDRVTFIKRFSLQAELPERVDVVLADQIGQFGFEAGVLEYSYDARQRFLKLGGNLIPSRIELWAAPVEIPELYANVEFWSNRPANFDFQTARAIAVNTGYPVNLEPKHLLSEPGRLASLDLSTSTTAAFKGKSSYTTTRAGQMHGVGGWFSAQLSSSVVMTNSPLATARINRRNAFFPIDRPVDLGVGDRVLVTMHIVPTEGLVTWNVEVSSDGNSTSIRKATFQHSTFKGMLLCQDDLRRTQPKFVPKLTPWGDARLSVLTLCDGQRPLAEIEKEVYRCHPKLFRSPAEAATFVAEVVTRYSQ
jgi:PRMT5 arginine-N-methyltransferase/ribosomal protein L11 methyltransferase PrmA